MKTVVPKIAALVGTILEYQLLYVPRAGADPLTLFADVYDVVVPAALETEDLPAANRKRLREALGAFARAQVDIEARQGRPRSVETARGAVLDALPPVRPTLSERVVLGPEQLAEIAKTVDPAVLEAIKTAPRRELTAEDAMFPRWVASLTRAGASGAPLEERLYAAILAVQAADRLKGRPGRPRDTRRRRPRKALAQIARKATTGAEAPDGRTFDAGCNAIVAAALNEPRKRDYRKLRRDAER